MANASYAQAGSGPLAGAVGWVNFSTIPLAPKTSTVVNNTLRDGTTISFTLSNTDITGDKSYVGTTAPTFPGATFGNPGGYAGISGPVVLYSQGGTIPYRSILSFSNIIVKDPSGTTLPDYMIVTGDGETTDPQENLMFETDGGVWDQIGSIGTGNSPTFTGLGTTTVTATGMSFAYKSLMLTTVNPKKVDITFFSNLGLSGVPFGVLFTKVQINKVVNDRVYANDQFNLSVTGSTISSTTITTGASNGTQLQSPYVYVTLDSISSSSFTLNETMALGSTGTLGTNYKTTVENGNFTPGGSTVPSSGFLGESVTVKLGDYMVTTITNTAITSTLTATKIVDKTKALPGDILTYAIGLSNSGPLTITNTFFQDTIPVGSSFINNSVTINGASVPGSVAPPSGLDIGTLPIGVTTLTFQVNLQTTLPINSSIINDSTATGLNVLIPTTVTLTSNSNTVITTVLGTVTLSSAKIGKLYANIGDVLTYTIPITNNGNTTAVNIRFIDTIPNGTSFVANSLMQDATSVGGSPNPPGITLPNSIGGGSTSTVTFQVTVTTMPSPNPIPNTASAIFQYDIDISTIPNILGSGSTNTNIVNTFVSRADLSTITKRVDKSFGIIGDILTYTISIPNTGSISANDVIFIDTIPNGTAFVDNSFTVNGVVSPGANPTPPGVNIGIIPPKGTSTVSFKVIVNTIPSPNPILNAATTTFTYQVDPSVSTATTGSANSNIVATKINMAKISNLNKQVDKSFATLGDTLNYTIAFNNTGSVTALNLVFKDTIPVGTTYVPNSFTINGATQSGQSPEYPTGVNIGDIAVGSTTTLGFQVTVSTIPPGNIIINGGTVFYDYIANDQTGQKNSSGGNTNLVITTTNFANLSNPIKSVDRKFADIGTTITYTITLTNTGNTTANNVAVIDTIPNGTTFVTDSVTVNGITQIGSSPVPPTGISIGPISSNETAIITFEVIVNTIPSPNPIPNTGTATYDFIVDPTLSISIRSSNVTNEVDTLVNHANLLNTKSVDKTFAKIGDLVNYTIGIANTGNTTAYNIVFTDTIPTDTTFVPNSLKINGITQTGKNPSPPTGVSVGPIPARSTSMVTFSVVVNTIPSPNPILNSSTTTFSYTVDPVLGITVNSNTNSNIVSTTINNALINGTKAVNLSEALVGDIITYSMDFSNVGNVSTNNISFTDTIPNGTQFVQNSIAINGVTVPGTTVVPPVGVTLPNLNPGENVNIKFQVLAITVPTPNPILNTGTAKYSFTVNPVLGIKGNSVFNTNTVPTFISPNTKPVKSVNTKYATVGDTLTYTLVWKNVLNSAQTDVVFVDTIPDSTTFIPGSITVNGSPQIGASISPPDGLYLGTLGKGAVVTVTYDVTVDTVPNNNIIDNDMTVIFNYVSNKELGTISRKSAVSNIVDTKVNLAKIENPTKSVDKEVATIGDVLTYTITFKNTGNTDANNTIFKDTIPQGTEFVPNSFTVNGVVQYGRNPGAPTGVNLGIIPAEAITTLTFKVMVDEDFCIKDVYNSGTLSYDFLVNPDTGRSKNDKVNTNTVLTKIIAAIICDKKTADSCTGFVGMHLKYTIVLANEGNTTAYNVKFVDTIPNGTAFVPNSVTLNSVSLPGAVVYPPTGVTIGNLDIDEVATISFMVTVETVPCPNPISNYGTVNFSYVISQGTDGQINKSINTNIAQTYIDPCSNYAKMYQDLYKQAQILDKEYDKLVCKAKELEKKAKEFEELAKIECFKAKVALEKGNKLNSQAKSTLDLAAFYSQQALECRKNMHNFRSK
ncbi:hypothetical protein [Romboutsia sp.]|uniref:hypothetical protein n=1 Tax=Romboutsia sp. TaxID=1965302 RepID=UPI003F2D48D6